MTLWKRLISQALLKDISVARSTVHMTNWLISTVTLGILSVPVQPPVMLIKMSANLSASPIQERILWFVFCLQFTHGCMNFLPSDCFFDGFLPEAERASDFTIVKCIRLSMRLLANLDWHRI
jgi:hypothetical protein